MSDSHRSRVAAATETVKRSDAEILDTLRRLSVPDEQIMEDGVLCGHCGLQMRGYAMVENVKVCHADPPYPDCYRLVTVYGEPLGMRWVQV